MTDTKQKFEVGDVVYYYNKFNGYTGPLRVEKIHKGNGNPIVNGTQYNPSGHETGTWSSGKIEHATPELTLKVNKIKKARVVLDRLKELTIRKVLDAEDALVNDLLILLGKFK